jgi:hypothetical protein
MFHVEHPLRDQPLKMLPEGFAWVRDKVQIPREKNQLKVANGVSFALG